MGNFFIFKANAPKMFTDIFAEPLYVHSDNGEVELRTVVLSVSLFCFHLLMCLVNNIFSVMSKHFNQANDCSQKCLLISLMVCSHQAVPPSRSSCTPPRNPPTVALFPPSIPAPCWTETWGESFVLSSLEKSFHFYYLSAFVLSKSQVFSLMLAWVNLQKPPVKPAPVIKAN